MNTHIDKQNSILLDNAWEWVNENFPFCGYIPKARKSSYYEMPMALMEYLNRGARVLDFGAGPCDKTAMLSKIGYEITAFDDLGDDWHNFEGNREKILSFASKSGIEFKLPNEDGNIDFPDKYFDAIVLNNVIEHFHDSPRNLLNVLLGSLKDGGFIFIDVPNAANLRKRIDIIRGKTNYPSFSSFYWSSYPWRGHVREFVKQDLLEMAGFLGVEMVSISSHHYHLDSISAVTRKIFIFICKLFPSLRESWMFVGKKPVGWKQHVAPTEEESAAAFSKQYFKFDKMASSQESHS